MQKSCYAAEGPRYAHGLSSSLVCLVQTTLWFHDLAPHVVSILNPILGSVSFLVDKCKLKDCLYIFVPRVAKNLWVGIGNFD